MKKILLVILIFNAGEVFSSHFRGADMWTSQLGANTYKFNMLLYADLFEIADHEEISIDWGDGNQDTLPRDYYNDDFFVGVRESFYQGVHVYSVNGTYTIKVEIANWETGFINMTSSDSLPFIGEITVVSSPLISTNNYNGWQSSQFYLITDSSNFSIDLAVDETDGDSIVIVQQTVSQLALGSVYNYPTAYGCSEYFTGTNYHCDNITIQGYYAVSFLFYEYKSGILTATHLRELLIKYQPPVGVSELLPDAVIDFYPNPTTEQLTINTAEPILLNIFDINAKIVLSVNSNSTVNVSKLLPGIYFINENGKNIGRFVKK